MIFSTRQKAFISQSYPLAFHTGKSAAAGGEDGGGARLGEAAPKIVSSDNSAECLSTAEISLRNPLFPGISHYFSAMGGR